MIDAGDLILHKPTGQHHMVCCVHDQWLHTAGHPEKRLMVSDCIVEEEATAEARMDMLHKLAQVQGSGHRPKCARARLDAMPKVYESGAC